jgi:hypothetical protein
VTLDEPAAAGPSVAGGSSGPRRVSGPLLAARPVVLAGLLTILAWPIANSATRANIDGSWQIALHLAAATGLQHGVDIVWTYGPLGFLGFPHPYVGATSSLALAASIGIYLALIGTMLVEARRILPLWAALVVTLLVARIFVLLPPFEAFQALVFVWSVEALADRIPWPTPVLAATGGILAGVAVLGKVNVGMFVVLMGIATIAFISRPWWKGLAVFVVVAAVSGLAAWVAAGQHLSDLGAYVAGVYQIVSGYNDAMGADPGPKRTWIFLALAGAAAIVSWTGWQTSRTWPRRRRIGLAVVGLIFGFAMWKTAVVREHATFVLATAVVAMFPFAPRIERRTWLVAVLGLGLAFAGSSAIEPRIYLNVVGSVESIVGEARDAFQPGRGDQAAARTRMELQASYGIDPATLAAIGGHTVHLDPYQTSVAFAYPELRWAPLPVFQSYSAYTPPLDRINADLLRSAVAPERILRGYEPAAPTDLLRSWIGRPLRPGEVLPSTVDGRFRWFESPDGTLEMFCRYVQTVASDRWQVLARTDRSCGPPEPLGTVKAQAGEAVSVPIETRPDRFVIVRIGGVQPSLLGRVRAALFKARDWHIKLDDTRYRLVPDTATDGLLLAVPPSADGSGPFAFGAPIRTIAASGGQKVGLTYEFLSVPLLQP